jgi:trk system potassium uptake protein
MSQIAIIGLGRFGFQVAKELHIAGHDVLAIDIDAQNVQRIRDFCSRAVVLDARDRERLEELGVADFDTVVVSLGERIDASALIVLHLQDLRVRRIITKAGSEDHARLLARLGVHEIVTPEKEVARRLAQRLANASVLDFIPLGDEHSIHELAPSDELVGHTLGELRLRNLYGVQVLGIRDVLTQRVHVNPGADFRIKESDALVVLGSNEDLARLRKP